MKFTCISALVATPGAVSAANPIVRPTQAAIVSSASCWTKVNVVGNVA